MGQQAELSVKGILNNFQFQDGKERWLCMMTWWRRRKVKREGNSETDSETDRSGTSLLAF